eukprot:gene14098-16210_t
MKAVYFRHDCFLVKDQCTIEVLQKSGLGARVLNPIITSAESVEADDASPLLLLDEEVELAKSQDIATPEFLWSSFIARNANFPSKYKVFSYYKDKGYVVRTGINFGVDYCIYHTLPSLCHSEMCVTVIDATKDSTNPSEVKVKVGPAESVSVAKEDLNQLNWRHVTTLTRVIPDVNKLCVLCYVLPSSDIINIPASEVAPICGQTNAAPSRVSPLDILADAVDDICVTENTVGPAATAISEDSNNSVRMSTSVVPTAPIVSPYLSSLFPSYSLPNNTLTEIATSTPVIDFSTPACLESLSVHPVTALVRRMPALAETYQTIKKVQETYHSASTAQKKRDIKAATQKEKSNKKNNNGSNGNKKKHNQNNKYAQPATDSVNTENNTTNTSDHSLLNADQQDYLLSADPATLSGRQKRVVKYLQKAQTQQKTAVLLPQSKQMKERRDHRENRSKTMSNKNQSLLDLMQGGEKKHIAASSEGNTDISISGEADTAVCIAGASAYAGEEKGTDMQTNDGMVDAANDDASAGTKRKFAEKSEANDEGSFWSIAKLFNPFAPASSTEVLGPNRDTVTLSTSNATGTGCDSTSGPLDFTDETSTVRRKRCRTQYGQNEYAATNGETNTGYMGRAVKHCIIL